MKPSIIRGAAGVLLALAVPPAAAPAQEHPDGRVVPQRQLDVAARTPAGAHPFAAMAGAWSGGGLIALTNDIQERLRCRANHTFNQSASSIALNIRCASDNYKFELTSNVVERRGQITGQWREASYNVSGTITGNVSGNRITAMARGDSFTSSLSVTTTGNQQQVSMTPERTYVISVQIALNRTGGSERAAR
jgi:hypothetical protein